MDNVLKTLLFYGVYQPVANIEAYVQGREDGFHGVIIDDVAGTVFVHGPYVTKLSAEAANIGMLSFFDLGNVSHMGVAESTNIA